MSSIYHGQLTVSIFGQSHAPAIGVTVDGLPAGEPVDLEELQVFLNRRAPGTGNWSTPRKEGDQPEFLSGLSQGRTCGAPLTAVIRNTNTRSGDYADLRDIPRPGHADYTAQVKYGGFQDVAGGGHFSGRLTAPLCIAGGICKQMLARRGIWVGAHIAAIGGIWDRAYDPVALSREDLLAPGRTRFSVLAPEAGERMQAAIAAAKADRDSLGGIIECGVVGLPAGLGDPMLDGMENRIARLAFAIPAVKGVEFGAGFAAARLRGSENNDPFCVENGKIVTKTNHCGGILGGISNGMPVVFRAAFKPTPSISREQDSVSLSRMEETKLVIHGRHDPCIVPRAVPCVEAAAAIAVLDVMERDGLVENAATVGEYLLGELHKIGGLKEVRGRGLMIGIELDGSGSEFRKRLLFEKHIFTGGAGASTVRLLPALCLTRELADRFLNAFKELVR